MPKISIPIINAQHVDRLVFLEPICHEIRLAPGDQIRIVYDADSIETWDLTLEFSAGNQLVLYSNTTYEVWRGDDRIAAWPP